MTPAPVFVFAVVSDIMRGDWELARWAARKAVLARVAALFDDARRSTSRRCRTAPESRMAEHWK